MAMLSGIYTKSQHFTYSVHTKQETGHAVEMRSNLRHMVVPANSGCFHTHLALEGSDPSMRHMVVPVCIVGDDLHILR